NSTGDTLFDRATLAAASVALQQSTHVRVYPRTRLPTIYGLMGIMNRDTTLSFELAQEVAERDHVRCVLGIFLSRTINVYRVVARLADVDQHRVIAELSDSSRSADGVLRALDDVLTRVRQSLGESRRDVAARRVPLPLVTTASLEALRSYADGAAAWERSDYKTAREHWERAVDLDTGFAMALGALGKWNYYTHDREAGERYFAAALSRSNRLTEWEQLTLRINRAFARGNTDSSLVLSRLRAERFPSVYSWYDLGTALMRANRDEEAIEALRRALRFDSLNVNTWINIATSTSKLKRDEPARLAYREAERIDPTVLYRNNVNNEYGRVLVDLGRVAEAESAFKRMATAPRIEDRALGLRSLAFLAFWRGRVQE